MEYTKLVPRKDYHFLKERKVGIVGVSIKEGQDYEGTELAPQTLRKSGLLEVVKGNEWTLNDYNDITTIDSNHEKEFENKDYKYKDLKNIKKIGAVNKILNDTCQKIAKSGEFCLTIGGDHSLSSGSLTGLKQVYPNLKLVWIDANGDCNTPEISLTGNYHGMTVAHLLGLLGDGNVPGFEWFKGNFTSKDIVIIGLRTIDHEEKKQLKKLNIKCYTMHDILKHGISKVIDESLSFLGVTNDKNTSNPVHISWDIGAVDPSEAFATGTKSRGGLLYRESQYIVREIVNTGSLVGLDMVEINPLLDTPLVRFHGDNRWITASTESVALGLEIISCALGDFQEML